ncbi:MAG: substrate-binding domain-containing protein [Paracoccaceae bacterium]
MSGIKRLADQLDISIGTVSRALNNRPGVNAETRDKVLRLAQEIGYVANASGRNLRSGSTNTVGVVLETGQQATAGGDNFFLALVDGMQEVLSGDGIDLVLLPCRRAADPVDFLQRIVRRGIVDSILITATRQQDPRIELLLQNRVPFLTLGRSGTPGDYPWVDLDFEGAARTSIRHLAQTGHRRIATVIPESDVNLAKVYKETWIATLAETGLEYRPDHVIPTEVSENGGMAAAQKILRLSPRPDAITLCSEQLSIGLYNGLAAGGLRPGRDISVIGFRDNPQLRFLDPALTSFNLDVTELGRFVGAELRSISQGPLGRQTTRKIWPLAFVSKQSVTVRNQQ